MNSDSIVAPIIASLTFFETDLQVSSKGCLQGKSNIHISHRTNREEGMPAYSAKSTVIEARIFFPPGPSYKEVIQT